MEALRSIAHVSKMKKFTKEICLHEDGQFYAVDYANADPDMNPRSLPDEVVRHIIWLLVPKRCTSSRGGTGTSTMTWMDRA